MLALLKLPQWEEKPPMAFYLTPLKESIARVRDDLLEMRNLGPNRSKYFIEDNEKLHTDVIAMVSADVTAQWLMGDPLKTEQLCFLYDVVKIIYETALRNALLNMKEEVLQEVIPRLAVYCTLLHMRRILDVKEEEKKHEKRLKENADEFEEEKQAPVPGEEEKDDEAILRRRVEESMNKSNMS